MSAKLVNSSTFSCKLLMYPVSLHYIELKFSIVIHFNFPTATSPTTTITPTTTVVPTTAAPLLPNTGFFSDFQKSTPSLTGTEY